MTRTLDTAVTRGAPTEAPHRKYQRRNALLRTLGYENYGAYLRSACWKRTRAAYRASDLPQDCICGDPDTQLHHLTYQRVGEERLSDLTPLCPSCHSLVHVLEWRGTLGIDLEGLTDAERAQHGREWLTNEAQRLKDEAAARLLLQRQAILATPFPSRLVNAKLTAKRRHVDISHLLHLLKRSATSGQSDKRLTLWLRRIEAKAYGWDDWA
jgi:hypothetical protein